MKITGVNASENNSVSLPALTELLGWLLPDYIQSKLEAGVSRPWSVYTLKDGDKVSSHSIFFTGTYKQCHDYHQHIINASAFRDLQNFFKRVRRLYGKFEFLRCFEYHKSGYLHVHALMLFHKKSFNGVMRWRRDGSYYVVYPEYLSFQDAWRFKVNNAVGKIPIPHAGISEPKLFIDDPQNLFAGVKYVIQYIGKESSSSKHLWQKLLGHVNDSKEHGDKRSESAYASWIDKHLPLAKRWSALSWSRHVHSYLQNPSGFRNSVQFHQEYFPPGLPALKVIEK